jgi:hypothetical protein
LVTNQYYRHDYSHEYQLLEVDMSGRPCDKKAAIYTKSYFAKQRNRRGRQEGYGVATWYDEMVVERLYEGTTQLNRALRPLVEAAESCWNWMRPRESAPSCGSIRVPKNLGLAGKAKIAVLRSKVSGARG